MKLPYEIIMEDISWGRNNFKATQWRKCVKQELYNCIEIRSQCWYSIKIKKIKK